MISVLATMCLAWQTAQPRPSPSTEPAAQPLVHEDLRYRDSSRTPRRHRLDLLVPPQPASEGAAASGPGVVLFVHGGSWTRGSKERFRHIGDELVAGGFAVAMINTRLFPFARPAQMADDVAAALGFVHQNAKAYGCDGDRLFVMGHSSGAHLCSWVAFDDQRLGNAGVPRTALRGAVLLSGPYDVRCHNFVLDSVFGDDPNTRRAATTWLTADAAAPPTLLMWAQRDLPGLPLCARMLAGQLRGHGVPVHSIERASWNHVNYMFGGGDGRDRLVPAVLRFLRQPRRIEPAPEAARPRLVWLAADATEEALGTTLAKAAAARPFEVVVQRLASSEHNPAGVERALQAAATTAGETRLFAAACGETTTWLSAAQLPDETAYAGRVLVSPTLAAVRGDRTRQLGRTALLTLCGEGESKKVRQAATACAVDIMRRGGEAHPIELLAKSGLDAVRQVTADDDLLLPMLQAYVMP